MCKTSIFKNFFLVYTTLHCQSTDRIRIRILPKRSKSNRIWIRIKIRNPVTNSEIRLGRYLGYGWKREGEIEGCGKQERVLGTGDLW